MINKTDEEYWEEYKPLIEDGLVSKKNHDLNLNIAVEFKGINEKIVFETKENDINCNLMDLEAWFSNLKKLIRLQDESLISDRVIA
jgi:hypothetical protein